jgi:hypothetical protein
MNKKAIIILATIFLLIVGTLGFLIYSRYSNNQSDNTETTNNNEVIVDNSQPTQPEGGSGNNPTTTPVSTEKFIKLTQGDSVISPILFYNGNGVTYMTQAGKLMKADFENLSNGTLQLTRNRNIEMQSKSNIEKILWPKSGDDLIAVLNKNTGGARYSYFNFSTGNYTDLPEQISYLEWLPSGDKIVFIWNEKKSDGSIKSTLNIAKPDTTGYQEIAELWENDDMLYTSPDGLNVAFHRTENNSSVNKLTVVSIDGKVWKDLSKEGYSYGVLWSPDSQKVLFGKRERNGRNFQLWLYDLYDGQVKNLGVYGAPQKAVWAFDSRTMYFATPKSATEIIDPVNLEGSLSVFTSDTFFKLDTQTMEKIEFMPENLSIDARDLFLNPAEDKVFFKNAQDSALYYLNLVQ